ncbi:hypothetical protein [Streptacidiphilus sp. EB129]|jgi:hypothetical protein|uniref:hypothetical protein n=1 Tax=Streptacidiphilus sp. EB129 TaxID=3156262 RepID=UPI0035139A09
MNQTLPLKIPSHLDGYPVCRLGKWLFVPDRRNTLGHVRVGYLAHGSELIALPYSSGILFDFVQAIRQIEANFTERCDGGRTHAG